MSKQKKIVSCLFPILLLLLMIFIATYANKASIKKEKPIQSQQMNGKDITYNGKTYRYNKDLVNVLFLGVDQRGPLTDIGEVGKGGQADEIILASFDKKKKTVKFLDISRDSMVKVARHDSHGKFYDFETMQLCLQYAYGKTHEESGNLMKERVSDVLYGLPIEHYFSMNLDPIPIINDAVGGVKVTLEDDFTFFDPSMKKGESVILKGEQAVCYIWDRRMTVVGNAERMERQKIYMDGWIKNARKAWKKDITLPLQIVEQIRSCIHTDLSDLELAQCVGMGLKCKKENIQLVSVPGEVTNDGLHWQFYIDEEKLQNILFDMFYQEIN
ncbi:MAG: LCP family protein [Lachnospiraceae bacterium]